MEVHWILYVDKSGPESNQMKVKLTNVNPRILHSFHPRFALIANTPDHLRSTQLVFPRLRTFICNTRPTHKFVERKLFNQLCRRVRRNFVFLGKVLSESFIVQNVEIVSTDQVVESFGGLWNEREHL